MIPRGVARRTIPQVTHNVSRNTASRSSSIYAIQQLDRRRRHFSDRPSPNQTYPPPPPPPSPVNRSDASSDRDGQQEQEQGQGEKQKQKQKQKQKSAHAQWYADTVPAMIPVALLGSAVYFALLLTQQKLSTEKYLDDANARIQALEAEIVGLREKQLTSSSGSVPVAAAGDSKRHWWSWW